MCYQHLHHAIPDSRTACGDIATPGCVIEAQAGVPVPPGTGRAEANGGKETVSQKRGNGVRYRFVVAAPHIHSLNSTHAAFLPLLSRKSKRYLSPFLTASAQSD